MATDQNATNVADVTGLDLAKDRKEAEYDLVTALLEAADYRNSEEAITTVDIKRAGKFMFSVRVRPVSDEETRKARKKATTYMPNPNNKKLPPVERDFNDSLFKSWLIYMATIPEDQEKVWGNKAIRDKFSLSLPVEAIDVLLTIGEKNRLADAILDVSGVNDEDGEENVSYEDYIKN